MILRLRKGVTIERLGFKKDTSIFSQNSNFMYTYEFLTIDPKTYEISICSGVNEVNGNKELIKLFELVNLGYVELVDDTISEKTIGIDFGNNFEDGYRDPDPNMKEYIGADVMEQLLRNMLEEYIDSKESEEKPEERIHWEF